MDLKHDILDKRCGGDGDGDGNGEESSIVEDDGNEFYVMFEIEEENGPLKGRVGDGHNDKYGVLKSGP